MLEVEIDGIIRDLRHLQEFVVTVAGRGRDGADLRVAVRLGTHTISEGCKHGQHNMLDENGKPRRFCEDRYAFSLALPVLAKRMIEQNYFVWESADRNQAMNYAVIDVAPGRVLELRDGEHQVIFFYLFPVRDGNCDVRLVVTSCHKRYMKFHAGTRRYNLSTLLRKCHFAEKRMP